MNTPQLCGYSLAFARDMIPAKMAAYSSSLPPIYAKFAGRYLAIGGPGRGVEHLHGDWGPRAVMLGEFPDVAAIDGFWWSPDYRAAAKLREGAVTVDACRLSGRLAAAADRAVLVVALRTVDGQNAAAALQGAAAMSPGATVLAPLSKVDLQVLEGGLAGHSVGIVAFADLEALHNGWRALQPTLQACTYSLQAYAVARAPTT
jgi:uncharacterized protein (DUF1330 family)